MASLVATVVDGYNTIWDLRDRRVENWLFMGSPLSTLAICLSYVMLVKVWGPAYMKNRPAFQFRRTLVIYNAIQVIFSTWLFYEIAMSGWANSYSYRCQPVDYTDNPLAIRMVYACWWYYFSKFTEFFDTIFFVLRKKDEHVSLLHVVHHGIMPMSVWFGVRFTPGGHSTFFGLLNTFVHIVMYFYYMVAAMGPQYQKFIWWKKYLTAFQMVQFIAIVVHAFQLLFIDCNYPKAFVWWIGCHGVLFFCLFSDFYKRSYKNAKSRIAAATNGLKANGHSNGYSNGSTSNGHSNGHTTNGHANGHSNGHANGKTHEKNGHSNGHSNGYTNGALHSKNE
ncbi:elongation of very long chain fatty acids protein AAEL008004-like isoform X1 [Daphnia pulex]|uniref:elongation of very long chain fatty acids protein AAEL008004-like isoform X1 n=1 Tax=Daphnia pulex TaxID=6669 RepID=UPI001EDD6F1F|nr:elongation of very long chain fatty acids protein AAEL008004-like isoform X1 [Daphnia pulex]XP_046446998.1 elongation of very long chain fatty acids protein AAEL008004-like isoform X1 [Daphnia pulex]XP_046447000.1 elongation of very long chain fatty acids protein AAEL008004-like isoform X1 [Daphnia pulex]XP_046635263.1 elongation of very long chain fatty acids protein AAEL008004-like isoform X2 [Daphnia pulicaria]